MIVEAVLASIDPSHPILYNTLVTFSNLQTKLSLARNMKSQLVGQFATSF